MCSIKEGFKLCSCGKKIKRKTFFNKLFWKKEREVKYPIIENNTWHLFSLENKTYLDGELMIPDEEFHNRIEQLEKDNAFIVGELNRRNDCFDFPYSPKDDDKLVLRINNKEIILMYEDMEWYLVTPGTHALTDSDYWLLNNGVIKNLPQPKHKKLQNGADNQMEK